MSQYSLNMYICISVNKKKNFISKYGSFSFPPFLLPLVFLSLFEPGSCGTSSQSPAPSAEIRDHHQTPVCFFLKQCPVREGHLLTPWMLSGSSVVSRHTNAVLTKHRATGLPTANTGPVYRPLPCVAEQGCTGGLEFILQEGMVWFGLVFVCDVLLICSPWFPSCLFSKSASLFFILCIKMNTHSVSITDNSRMITPFGLLLSQNGLRLCSSGSCSDLLKNS